MGFYDQYICMCQGMRYIRSMSHALLAITELPSNELRGPDPIRIK